MKWPAWIKEKLNSWAGRQTLEKPVSSNLTDFVGSTPTPPTKYPTFNPRYPISPSEKYTYLDYGIMSRDQLEPIFYDALKKRHWQYDMNNLEFYHEWSREILPDMRQMRNAEYGIRRFCIDYLIYLDLGLEQEAHQHLQKMMNKRPVEEMYDLYMRLIQTPITRMKHGRSR